MTFQPSAFGFNKNDKEIIFFEPNGNEEHLGEKFKNFILSKSLKELNEIYQRLAAPTSSEEIDISSFNEFSFYINLKKSATPINYKEMLLDRPNCHFAYIFDLNTNTLDYYTGGAGENEDYNEAGYGKYGQKEGESYITKYHYGKPNEYKTTFGVILDKTIPLNQLRRTKQQKEAKNIKNLLAIRS